MFGSLLVPELEEEEGEGAEEVMVDEGEVEVDEVGFEVVEGEEVVVLEVVVEDEEVEEEMEGEVEEEVVALAVVVAVAVVGGI